MSNCGASSNRCYLLCLKQGPICRGGRLGGFNPPNDFFDPQVSVNLSYWGSMGQKCCIFDDFSLCYSRSVTLKMLQMRLRPGLCPRPRWGSSRRSPSPPSRLGREIPPPHTPPLSAPAAPRPSRLSATPNIFFYKSDTGLKYIELKSHCFSHIII